MPSPERRPLDDTAAAPSRDAVGGRDGPPPGSPELEPLRAFVGTWRGEGRGTYPTIAPFGYGEEIRLRDVGRPFLVYEQRTWSLPDGRPLHAETGYWRPRPDGRIELLIAQATGMVEVDEGSLVGGRITVRSSAAAAAATGPEVTAVEREIELRGDELRYELRMAAVGQPMLVHLVALLRRAEGPG